MIKIRAKNESQAKKEAIHLSEQNAGMYVEVFSCFGAFACLHKSISIQMVGDSKFGWYAINGKIKSFTDKQRSAYTNYCLDGKH